MFAVKLGKPHLAQTIISESNLSIRIELNHKDYHTRSRGIEGFIEHDINRHGVKYRVVVNTERDSQLPTTKVSFTRFMYLKQSSNPPFSRVTAIYMYLCIFLCYL